MINLIADLKILLINHNFIVQDSKKKVKNGLKRSRLSANLKQIITAPNHNTKYIF